MWEKQNGQGWSNLRHAQSLVQCVLGWRTKSKKHKSSVTASKGTLGIA
jgi:hypothetical protein